MTTGIYKLYWDNIPTIYIGKAQDIDERYKKHCRDLTTSTHCNSKISDIFLMYGLPNIQVLEECTIDNLNEREIWWIDTLDTINNGLNICAGGRGGYGPYSASSVYTKLQILKVFRYLYNTTLQFKDISKLTKVNISSVSSISRGASHLWLKDSYPYLYSVMRTRNLRIKPPKVYPILYNGTLEEEVHSIAEFSLKYNLDRYCVGKVIRGQAKSHKGWKLRASKK